jgi:cell division protein FtsN
LYYDDKLKIVGEASLSGVSVGNETFATPIDSNKIIKELYSKSLELLSIDTTEYKNSTSLDEKFQELIDSTDIGNQQNVDATNNKLVEKAKPNKQGNTNPILETSQPVSSTSGKSLTASQSSGYNLSVEENVRSTIFTDGNKFCFQVSSWRNKNKAEREVTRLKGEGFNAFLVETYLPNKGGNWYRVRIGYFSSLEETENYMGRMK